MDFWSAAGPAADAQCFVIAGRAAGVASGCSRDTQAPRNRYGKASAAQGRFRAPAPPRCSKNRRGIHVLPRLPGNGSTAARAAGVAKAFAQGGGAQLSETLHPRGFPPVAGKPGSRGFARAAAVWSESLAGDGSAPAATVRQIESMIARCLVCLVSAYRLFVSPLLPVACRF